MFPIMIKQPQQAMVILLTFDQKPVSFAQTSPWNMADHQSCASKYGQKAKYNTMENPGFDFRVQSGRSAIWYTVTKITLRDGFVVESRIWNTKGEKKRKEIFQSWLELATFQECSLSTNF